jgi:hypothetical protein
MMDRPLVGTFVLALAAIVSQTSSVQAGSLSGSLPLISSDVTEDGSDLSTSTTITAATLFSSGPGTGDYAPIPGSNGTFTSFGGPIVLDLSTLTLTTLSNSTFGSFTASSVEIVSQSSSFLDVFVLGTFTPGSGLGTGFTASASSLNISINQNGASLSEALTLSTPPVTVPEPASLIMGVTSALACGLFFGFARRSKKAIV